MGLEGKTSVLASPASTPPQGDCFMFFYTLSGGGVERLSIRTLDGEKYETVWELQFDEAVHTGKWEVGQVNISGRNIEIEAAAATTEAPGAHTGYAAVDEFLLLTDVERCEVWYININGRTRNGV